MFHNQVYGPRNGLEPRDWQMECSEVYADLVGKHQERYSGNGVSVHQHRFTIYAGTGSGKTKTAGILASWQMNSKEVEQLAIICPNISILRKTRKDFLRYFNIDLMPFGSNSCKDGIKSKYQGYITTYQGLMKNPALHHQVCSYRKTLVIFDEVHHLGDKPEQRWGDSALNAFGDVPYVLCLTGTPYRSDNTRIPFVSYEDTERGGLLRFKADQKSETGFTYSLGRAINEKVCRKPQFFYHKGEVQIRPDPEGPYTVASFDDEKVSDQVASLRLRGAVMYGTETRLTMLREAIEMCSKDTPRRKIAIFLGGDTQGETTAKMDAKDLLPGELAKLGISESEYEVVVSNDGDDTQGRIEAFGESDKWILISIGMVSEGTDIPELSAIVLMTSITAKQTTIQRIGRGLRMRGENDPHKTCLVFLFADPSLVEIATDIDTEVEIEQKILESKKRSSPSVTREDRPSRPEAFGISGGHIETVRFGNKQWPIDKFRQVQKALHDSGIPSSCLDAALHLILAEGGIHADGCNSN